MNTDELLRETLRGLEDEASGLDPARVIAGAKRRRVRRTAAAATASATLTATVIGAFALYPAPGSPPVADGPATVTAPVARPLPVIRDGEWKQLSKREWFRIEGLRWRLGDRPGTKEWTGIGDELGRESVDSAWHPSTGGIGNYWSTLTFLPADVHRATYTVVGDSKTFRIDARVYRLASAPAWVIAFADYPAPGPVATNGSVERLEVFVNGFDAAGKLVVRCEPPRQSSKNEPPTPACQRVR